MTSKRALGLDALDRAAETVREMGPDEPARRGRAKARCPTRTPPAAPTPAAAPVAETPAAPGISAPLEIAGADAHASDDAAVVAGGCTRSAVATADPKRQERPLSWRRNQPRPKISTKVPPPHRASGRAAHLADLVGAGLVTAMILCYFVWNPIFDFRRSRSVRRWKAQSGLRADPAEIAGGFFVAMRIAFSAASCWPSGGGLPALALYRAGALPQRKRGVLPVPDRLAGDVPAGRGFRLLHHPALGLDFFLGFQQAAGRALPPLRRQGPQRAPSPPRHLSHGRASSFRARSRNICADHEIHHPFGVSFQMPVALTLLGKAGWSRPRG